MMVAMSVIVSVCHGNLAIFRRRRRPMGSRGCPAGVDGRARRAQVEDRHLRRRDVAIHNCHRRVWRMVLPMANRRRSKRNEAPSL